MTGPERSRPVAVVLNVSWTGLGIARNLGRHGIPVIGVSWRSGLAGDSSRYCRNFVGPDSREEPEKLAEMLAGLGQRWDRRGIVFPTRDADVLFLDRFRERLEPFFVIPQPRHDLLDRILNKERLARTADALGISTPCTERVASAAELEQKRDRFVFPAVVKPVYAEHWRIPNIWRVVGKRKGIRVETFEELQGHYRSIASCQPVVLVQEWVPGPADQFYIVGAYLDQRSEPLGVITAQKLLQFPPDFGLGCLVRSIRNDDVRALGIRLLQSIGFHGIAEVEFKRDSRTGSYRLIEINPRHWDQHPLATACGVNLSYLAYRDLCEQRPSRAVQRRVAACWVSGQGLTGSLKECVRMRRWNGAIALLLRPGKRVYPLWDWRDPSPFWNALTRRTKSELEDMWTGPRR